MPWEYSVSQPVPPAAIAARMPEGKAVSSSCGGEGRVKRTGIRDTLVLFDRNRVRLVPFVSVGREVLVCGRKVRERLARLEEERTNQ